jgi:hypothetical protein
MGKRTPEMNILGRRSGLTLDAARSAGWRGGRPRLGPAPWLDPDRIELREPAASADAIDTFAPFDTFNRIAVRNAYRQSYAPAMPSMAWTGSIAGCNAGTISTAFKEWTISRVNFARAMAGLPGNISLDATNSAKAQQAALMFSANQSLSHTPPASWVCYTAGRRRRGGPFEHRELAGLVRVRRRRPALPR